MATRVDSLPKAFIWRRVHSLMGLWLVLFLMEHLLTNSQAALLLGENGQGFVRMVNGLHNLPYLHVVEIVLLGVPILLHAYWGVMYAVKAKYNSLPSDGSKPSLKYGRNRAYSWQRYTSYILLILLTTHIVKFRFLEYPEEMKHGLTSTYSVRVDMDEGLPSVAERLGATIDREDDKVIVTADNFGTATLFSVRNTFKSPFWVAVYTVFVLSACFHAFNGLWTFMLSWGWVIKVAGQKKALKFAMGLMFLLAFLGLAAVWGTYFLNLKS